MTVHRCTTVTIPRTTIHDDSMGEPDLYHYMIKLRLLEAGVPVIIDPLNVRSRDLQVEHGCIVRVLDSEDFEYLWCPELRD